jgi:hypothetical protein
MPASVYAGACGARPAVELRPCGRALDPDAFGNADDRRLVRGRGRTIPVRQGAFTSQTFTPKKMAVISTFTREIAEHSTPAIEGLIRNAMQEDTSVAVDTVLLDATAASTTRPAGLRNGVATLTATAGGGFAALVGDLKAVRCRTHYCFERQSSAAGLDHERHPGAQYRDDPERRW